MLCIYVDWDAYVCPFLSLRVQVVEGWKHLLGLYVCFVSSGISEGLSATLCVCVCVRGEGKMSKTHLTVYLYKCCLHAGAVLTKRRHISFYLQPVHSLQPAIRIPRRAARSSTRPTSARLIRY